jgi:serine protease Do
MAKQVGFDSSSGAFVREVFSDGPAVKGGIRVGDMIRRINDREIRDYKDVLDVVSSVPSGNNIKITILRGGKTINLYVTVASRPD